MSRTRCAAPQLIAPWAATRRVDEPGARRVDVEGPAGEAEGVVHRRRGGRHGQVGGAGGQHEQVDLLGAEPGRARGPGAPASVASADTVPADAALADARARHDPFVGGVEAGLEVARW